MNKVMILASFSFAKEMVEAKKLLLKKGFTVIMEEDAEIYATNPHHKETKEGELHVAGAKDVMRSCLDKVASADQVLVLNHDKKGIKGYLGTSVLMELGVAYYLKKKITLLNQYESTAPYALELDVMKPTILHGDVTKFQ
ncbi:MAG: hypothetical protein AABY01_02250 [Nanoarchaeota archaeon]